MASEEFLNKLIVSSSLKCFLTFLLNFSRSAARFEPEIMGPVIDRKLRSLNFYSTGHWSNKFPTIAQIASLH